jgi:hypothetical protein
MGKIPNPLWSFLLKISRRRLFCDSDWGGNVDTRRSTTSYVFLLGGAAVSWASKKQSTVAFSSTKAEYMACIHATKEALWLRRFLCEVG